MPALTATKAILLVLVCFWMCACTTPKGLYVHMPDKCFVPGINEKGEIRVEANIEPYLLRGNGFPKTFSTDVAYSPLNGLGVMASLSTTDNLRFRHSYGTYFGAGPLINGEEELNLSGTQVDIGLGYYAKITEQDLFEVYAGYGGGRFENKGSTGSDPGGYSGHYHRIFVQGDFAFRARSVNYLLGIKSMYKAYDDFGVSAQSKLDAFAVSEVMNNSMVLVQPFVGFQAGKRFVQFNFQLGYQILLHSYYRGHVASETYDLAGGYKYNTGLFYTTLGIGFRYSTALARRMAREQSAREKTGVE